MADSFFGFDTALSSVNEDEGGGGPSEDEYDALNDETFGAELDWEEGHEHMARLVDSSKRRNADEDIDVEASLSQLFLDDDEEVSHSGYSGNPRSTQDIRQLNGSHFGGNAPLPQPHMVKNLCTVEEIERNLRQQQKKSMPPQNNQHGDIMELFQQHQRLQNQNMGHQGPNMGGVQHQGPNMGQGHHQGMIQGQNMMYQGQNMQGTAPNMVQMQHQPQNFYQPRFPPMMLQRPPGLSGPPGPMPFPSNIPQRPNHKMMLNQPQNHQQMPMMMQPPRMLPPPGMFPQHNSSQFPPGFGMPPNMQPGNMPQNLHQIPQSHMQPNVDQKTGLNQHVSIHRNNADILKTQIITNSNQKNNQNNQQRLNNNQGVNQNNQLIQMIQTNHPMLNQNNLPFPVTPGSLHNANNHPLVRQQTGLYGNGQNNQNHNRSSMSNGYLEDDNGNSGSPSGTGNGDRYAGLMSSREKQWLLNIQMIQLNTGTPYVDDFYYTVFLDRQAKKEQDEIREAHKANQQNHPFYSGGKESHSQGRERHNSRHNSTSEESGPRTYVPTQFENSLGKLQCGSVTAPRKMLDLDMVQGEVPASPTTVTDRPAGQIPTNHKVRSQSSLGVTSGATLGQSELIPREIKKTKQLLLDIEALYYIILRLEEMNDPLAIANAVVLKEREEKQKALLEQQLREDRENTIMEQHSTPGSANLFLRNIEAVQKKGDLDSSNDPQAILQRNLLDENKDQLITKMFNVLIMDDKLAAILAVRKGKIMIHRFLSRVPVSHPQMHDFWKRLLRCLPIVARRDIRDVCLPPLYNSFIRYIQSWPSRQGWVLLWELFSVLEEGFAESSSPGRPASRATTPTPHRCPLHLALASQLTLSCISAMIEKADALIRSSDNLHSDRQRIELWTRFLQGLTKSLRALLVPTVVRPLILLDKAFMERHVEILIFEPSNVANSRRISEESAVEIGAVDVKNVLIKYLC